MGLEGTGLKKKSGSPKGPLVSVSTNGNVFSPLPATVVFCFLMSLFSVSEAVQRADFFEGSRMQTLGTKAVCYRGFVPFRLTLRSPGFEA